MRPACRQAGVYAPDPPAGGVGVNSTPGAYENNLIL